MTDNHHRKISRRDFIKLAAATGLLAGINAARLLQGQAPVTLPETTMLGSLCHYVTHAEPKDFQPMKANFGLMPPFEKKIRNKRERYQAYADRSLADLEAVIASEQLINIESVKRKA